MGGGYIEPPEVLYFYKVQSAQSESMLFMETPYDNENQASTSRILGAFSFDFPANNFQLIIQDQGETLLDLDSLQIAYPEHLTDPWVNAQKYPYLFATIFLGYNDADTLGVISPSYASFIKDLAENFFKDATGVYLGSMTYFTATGKYNIRDPILNSYFHNGRVSTIAGDTLNILWEYSEKVRKGEI